MAEDPLLFPPVLSNKRVAELVQTNYAISHVDLDSIKLLNGYEDRNYYLKVCCHNGEDKEYIFKMVNRKDSQYPEYFDALSKLMFFIKAKGLTCSLPIQPITVPDGTYIIHFKRSFMLQVDIEEDCIYVGILLIYLHGQIMSEIEQLSPKLLYNVGEFVGKLSTRLQRFSHPYFETRYLRFDVKNFLDNKPNLEYVGSEEDRKMIEQVFKWYSECVQLKMVYFKRGAIHNDLNCDNFICTKEMNENSWKFSGLIDIMDTTISCSVFDGANFIAHMMMKGHTNPLEYTGPAVSGYLSNYELNKEELDNFYYLVACCLTQLFMEGLKSCLLYPENSYRVRFMQRSRMALKILLHTPKDQVEKLWQAAKQKTIVDFK